MNEAQMAAAFNEWMRRFIEDPEGFAREFETVRQFEQDLAHQLGDEPSYGRDCAAYMLKINAELTALNGAVSMENGKAAAITSAVKDYMTSAGVPLTEFDPEFVVKMVSAMMVSFHKYGRVADAYPAKFDATSDVRARMSKYRATGNKHFLVDVANFAMIEAMHPVLGSSGWGTNDAADSPGRTSTDGRRLVQEDNDGNRIMGETILHLPDGGTGRG